MTEGRNPAVVAGLLSGLVLVAEPASAYALTANEIRQTPLGAIFTGIGVGLAAVAVISGAAVVVSRVANRGEKTDGAEAKIQPSTTSQVEDEAASPKRVAAASNFSPEESMVIPLDSPRRSIAAYKPKHMKASQWDMTGSIRVQSAELPVQPTKAPAKKTQVVTAAAEGVLPVRAKKAPAHSTNDYAQIAENYTKLLSWRERTVARAKGAAAVLLERLGQDPMDGLPIIERADGTVGDVGTAWWTKAVGEESITRDFGIAEIGAEAIPEDFTNHAAESSLRSARSTSLSTLMTGRLRWLQWMSIWLAMISNRCASTIQYSCHSLVRPQLRQKLQARRSCRVQNLLRLTRLPQLRCVLLASQTTLVWLHNQPQCRWSRLQTIPPRTFRTSLTRLSARWQLSSRQLTKDQHASCSASLRVAPAR